MHKILKNIDFIIFDLDGVFYKEDNPLKGTKEMIDFLEENNIEYCFFTNNSNYKPKRYKDKLLKGGVKTRKDKIFTTTKLLKYYLKENNIEDIYVLGSPQLQNTLYERHKKNEENPSCIVIGMDKNITLEEISKTINLIKKETLIIAANPDKLFPTKDNFTLECGVIIDVIKNITSRKIEIIGKPSNYGYEKILDIFKKEKKNTLMVGDTYETDILGAKNAGIHPVWIASGNCLPQKINEDNLLKFDSLLEFKTSLEKIKK